MKKKKGEEGERGEGRKKGREAAMPIRHLYLPANRLHGAAKGEGRKKRKKRVNRENGLCQPQFSGEISRPMSGKGEGRRKEDALAFAAA